MWHVTPIDPARERHQWVNGESFMVTRLFGGYAGVRDQWGKDTVCGSYAAAIALIRRAVLHVGY